MNIQPITEEAHNTATLTLTAERQELLYYRAKVLSLEEVVSVLQTGIADTEKLHKIRIEQLEAQIKDA